MKRAIKTSTASNPLSDNQNVPDKKEADQPSKKQKYDEKEPSKYLRTYKNKSKKTLEGDELKAFQFQCVLEEYISTFDNICQEMETNVNFDILLYQSFLASAIAKLSTIPAGASKKLVHQSVCLQTCLLIFQSKAEAAQKEIKSHSHSSSESFNTLENYPSQREIDPKEAPQKLDCNQQWQQVEKKRKIGLLKRRIAAKVKILKKLETFIYNKRNKVFSLLERAYEQYNIPAEEFGEYAVTVVKDILSKEEEATSSSSFRPPPKECMISRNVEPPLPPSILPFQIKAPATLYKLRKIPKVPCLFCGGCHHSFLCTDLRFQSISDRKNFYSLNGLCERCNGKHDVNAPHIMPQKYCRWLQCQSQDHQATLCPDAPYPISESDVLIWQENLRDLKDAARRWYAPTLKEQESN